MFLLMMCSLQKGNYPISGKRSSQYTHCLRARELGRNVEVDEILSHNNVRNTIAIISNLQREKGHFHH